MSKLELKIPPPIYLVIAVGLVVILNILFPTMRLSLPGSISVTMVLVLTGIGFELPALISFFRAKTTIWPIDPSKTSKLVTGGVYAVSRNPMYLGMAFILSGAIWYAGNLISLAVLPLFILVITRFQIIPEERFLEMGFGDDFQKYRAKVPRWL